MGLYLRIIMVVCLLSFLACKKKSTPAATPSVTTTPTAPATIDINHASTAVYTLDGANYAYTEGVNGVIGGTDNDKNINSSNSPVTTSAIYGSDLSNDSLNFFTVQRGTFTYSGVLLDTTLFKQAFAPGNINYSVGPANGIEIYHFDATGKLWSSSKGSANQAGSVFTIVNSKESYYLGYQELKIYATFNCKLYDDNGNSKTLTNGKFVGYFENN